MKQDRRPAALATHADVRLPIQQGMLRSPKRLYENPVRVNHYENFPVASILLPRHLRTPVSVIYQVARGADDVADEGDLLSAKRHAKLSEYRAGLDAVAAGRPAVAHTGLFAQLAKIVAAYNLPLEAFYDLISAFAQDIDTQCYATRDTLLDYCRRSANPVGRLMLALCGEATPRNLADSNAICTALQLINFWQDIAIDWAKHRVYLPQEDMQRYGVDEAQIAALIAGAPINDGWRALLCDQIGWTRTMLVTGAPLALRIPGRIGLELCSVVHGGLRILERLEQVGYDMFRHRPMLHQWDWVVVTARALRMRLSGQIISRPAPITVSS